MQKNTPAKERILFMKKKKIAQHTGEMNLSIVKVIYMPSSQLTSFSSVQFSSVAQSCPTPFYPMDHSTPGLPVHHQLPEFTQTHVH